MIPALIRWSVGNRFIVIVLALFLGRLMARSKPRRGDPHDINSSAHDGRASATWVGIREAGRDDGTIH